MAIKLHEDILIGKKHFNMVNSDDLELKKLGLKPLNIMVYPRYINLDKNVFYSGSTHHECRLQNDIYDVLKIMMNDEKTRFEFKSSNDSGATLRFLIYDNNIYFADCLSLDMYKEYSHIRNDIIREYNVKEEYYEPTNEEIYENYYEKDINNYNDVENVAYNLTTSEHLKFYYEMKKRTLKPYSNPEDLSGYSIRSWLNWNANIFMNSTCSMIKQGVYNKDTMNLINSLLESKLNIYESLYSLSKKSQDKKETAINLLKSYNAYKEVQDIVCDNPFDPDCDVHYKKNEESKMIYSIADDVLVQLIGFDKIESQVTRTITTSKPNIYEEFYNYLIMGYNVVQIPKLVFDDQKNDFKWFKQNEYVNTSINRECEEDVRKIKKLVPYDERHKYLR